MPLVIPEGGGMWFDAVEQYPPLFRDKIGSDTSEPGQPSLMGQLLAMQAAVNEYGSQEYWTGNAASACATCMNKLLTDAALGVVELATAVTELEKYLELYHYVDDKANAIADAAAAEAEKL